MAADKVTETVAESAGPPTDDTVIDKVSDEVNDQKSQQDQITESINWTGNHLAQWDADKFSTIIVTRAENAFKSKQDAFGLVLSALITLGSAGLNMWYLMDTAIGLRRDKHEDYNLTEWIVVMFEVIAVYAFFAAALARFVMLIFNMLPPSECLTGLNTSLKLVGNFSAFQYIKLLAIHNLKKQAFEAYAPCTSMFSTMKEEGSDIEVSLCCILQCLCCLPCILCACSCVLPSLGLVLLTYALGPAALLLKIRQVSFVMDTHVLDWPLHHYFSFFGFINNIAGLSANEDVQLLSFIKVLFMDEQEDIFFCGRDEAAKKLFGNMLLQALVEKGKMSHFKVWLILNSWSMDPDQFIELFKEPPAPSKAAESGSGSMEEQMAAHVDLAKSDVAGMSTEDVDGVRITEDMA